MGNDSIKKTLLVTVVLSLICSVLVSAAAVFLKPVQDQNIKLDVQRNILAISGLTSDAKALSVAEVAELYKRIQPRLVDLKTGKFVDEANGLTVDQYDQRVAAKDPKASEALAGSKDIAGIKRQADVAKVYLVEQDGKMQTLILPVHGYGLWSTMYGFLALENNLNTVKGFGFFEQAETPGLGGEVSNPVWKSRWSGKEIYGVDGQVALHVIKGGVDPANPGAMNQIDGLAGATLTANGVSNLIKFWLSDTGFKLFLNNLKAGNA
ncbi:Na(+)-translocating NADH-quinone reductase subunit C [Endozoicomonas elysicola]|uniref:Na(+)-translocating NADH-quinone reductase subunit C n=1 Tax=Endozoicomonas elysicola TaxID=305900 RepID=A0A081KB15_9GAMM|nr:Na(+)-translocating NADH-quinone reductase subunit C [Endozoicomonas elysicola]KEI71341.1 Na(+)-translocating NADH-quinone reductase subunit C [Endozoicomonas elysicola]